MFKSIKAQLMIYPMLAVLFLAVVLGLIVQNQLNRVPDHLMHQYEDIVESRSDTIDAELTALIDTVRMISQSNVIQSGDLSEIQAFLPTVVLQEKHRNMTVADTDGIAWTSNGDTIDISDQEQYEKIILEREPYWVSQPFISPYADPDVPIMIVSHEIRNDAGDITGLVNVVTEIYFLTDIVESVELGETGFSWILHNSGDVIIHPEVAVQDQMSLDALYPDRENRFQALIDGDLDWIEHEDHEGNDVFTFHQAVEEASTEWHLMFSIDKEEVLGEVQGIQSTITATLGMVIGLVVLFSLYFSNKMARPIVRLKDLFDEAEQGNSEVRADESVKNEIGEAARSFNAMHEKIRNLTYYDPLTKLYNFNGFLIELPFRVKKLTQKEGYTAIALISIDDFKRFNSLRGYQAGNEILRKFADRLTMYMQEGEMVGRYFGDEFILVMHANTTDNIERRIRTIWQNAMTNLADSEHGWNLKMSIGAVITKEIYGTADECLAQANMAKLQAKREGGNRYRFYAKAMTRVIEEDQRLENELNYALERGELELYYQPIVDVGNGEVYGNEALIRWTHPEYGSVSPVKMIEIAERSGQIVEIGEWVLKEGLRQNRLWQDQGFKPMFISINISVIQFEQPNFIRSVKKAIEDSGLDPKWIQLEITETTAMSLGDDKIEKMAALKGLGVSIAIDDFGTGYSSLAYFTQFPITTLKIDRTFISRLGKDPKAEMITEAVISMAETLRIQTVAEGVETAEQAAFLKELGCTYIQGFYFAKPMPPSKAENLFTKK
ncbi:bifunctional diguanylate cyclase/phosphodiesterase [Salisediminibacterium selenitireducens]|uniref:Diguanylate cyclase/phosphodiesterase with extracellular sensor n=1 Tax=Bacillus selenitireducens (strain ATCC 700615 / DSM 15326 / MLS10) TaxID=439292 RepID=D6XZ07_BACIE|nr:EAL domain-containing protein [Salisediminibacterium selenitireducens]ADI00292.1 diguanylate cyclase/phosphodiesterase with extracellular sensor [[Bacillus] selenitireducens MLS10]